MAKPKLKRQGLLGQFLVGVDPFGAPVQTTVPLDSAYTRTHQGSGLVIGGRSPREFYHPTPRHGVIYSVPHLTIYRYTDFSTFTGNANSYLVNGFTVDGLINPISPSGGGLMMFPTSPVSWQDWGLPPTKTPVFVTFTLSSRLTVELPQFVGYNSGGSHEGGYIDNIYTNIIGSLGSNLVSAGSIGVDTPQWPYDTGLRVNITRYDYSFVLAPPTFDFEFWINWQRPNGRWNLQSIDITMKW